MTAQASGISRQAIARSFSAAASTYDTHADLQRSVVDVLVNDIPAGFQPQTVLDLGSGTGYGSDRLLEKFPGADLFNLDLAEGMLGFHQSRSKADNRGFVCADAAQLPFASGTFDLVFSSLTLQWCADLQKAFREVRRVCNENACIMISTLGPRTLQEVSELWAQVDDYRHVNRFRSLAEIKEQAAAAGLLVGRIASSVQQRQYPTLQALGAELKGLGAHNLNPDQGRGLTGRRKIQKLKKDFEQKKREGVFTTGFDVLMLHLQVKQ